MNKYIRSISVGAILSLTSFIPLSYASESVLQNGPIQLASSFAIYSYAGEPTANGGCCAPTKTSYHKVSHKHHYKKHHKQKHKHHKKQHRKHHHKPKPSCGCA